MKPEKISLNQKQLDQITAVVAQMVLDYLDREKKHRQKAKKDWRHRNTKLLLKHFRKLVAHSEDVKEKILTEHFTEAMDELNSEDFAVESIKRSKQRTLAMVRFVQRMMNAYQSACEETGKTEEIRRYKIIDALFISDDKMDIPQLAECHKIDERTIYRDINDACNSLSVLIFGIDAIEFN